MFIPRLISQGNRRDVKEVKIRRLLAGFMQQKYLNKDNQRQL